MALTETTKEGPPVETEDTSEFDVARARRWKKIRKQVLWVLVVAVAAAVGWRFWSERPQQIWSKTWPTTNGYAHQDAMGLTLSGGFLYGLAADNTVHALAAGNGQEEWRFRPPSGYYAAGLAVRNRLAVVLVKPDRESARATASQLVGIDAFTGRERWRKNAGMNVRDASLALSSDSIYFSGDDGAEFSGNPEPFSDNVDNSNGSGQLLAGNGRIVAANFDGAVKWQAPVSGKGVVKVIGKSVVVVQEAKVDAFAAADGHSLWSYPVRKQEGYGFMKGIPRVVDVLPWRKQILLWQAPDRIFVRDSETGALVGQYRAKGLISKGFGQESLIVGDTLYVYSQFVETGSDDLRAIDLVKKKVKWATSVPARYSGWPFGTSSYDSRPLAYSNGKIYLGARDGFLHGFDAKTGKSKYKKRIYKQGGGFDWNTPPIVSNGVLYITEPSYGKGTQTPIDVAAYKAG